MNDALRPRVRVSEPREAPREILDASALLAFLQDESGAAEVNLQASLINAVNFSEVMQKSVQRGADANGLLADLQLVGLTVTSFSPEEAALAGFLWPLTRPYGLSLGDRACLASAQHYGLPVVTAERVWSKIVHGLEVRVIR